jgi:uncharacterized protein (DUF1786 family)
MKILTVDIGTGTQDIFLFDSSLDMENGFKLVVPSPTMMIHRRIKEATRLRTPILLTGKLMGGGPSAWAARDHAAAGIPTYATPEAAKTLDDEPAKVEKMGIKIISEDEARSPCAGRVAMPNREMCNASNSAISTFPSSPKPSRASASRSMSWMLSASLFLTMAIHLPVFLTANSVSTTSNLA